jgi:hypothetical protein
MKKFRIEAEVTLASNGRKIVEWLEDAHLTDGLDPAAFALSYAPSGVEKLLDLGYTEREVAGARFVMQPTRLQLV